MIPFHKQTDAGKLAGQVVNPIPEQYLHQYIERKTDEPKRMTFDEWWKKYDGGPDYSNTGIAESAAEDIWNAALTKGKL